MKYITNRNILFKDVDMGMDVNKNEMKKQTLKKGFF